MKRDPSATDTELDPPGASSLPDPAHAIGCIDGVVIGRVVRIDGGAVHVAFAGAPAQEVAARSLVAVTHSDNGRAAALSFEQADPHRPIVLGLIWQGAPTVSVDALPEKQMIVAEHELTLRCGEASITLTCDGKVLVRGAYVSTHAKGTNRIKGGSVRMN